MNDSAAAAIDVAKAIHDFSRAMLALPAGVPHDAGCDWCQVLDLPELPTPPPYLRLCVEHNRLAYICWPGRTDIRSVLKFIN